MAFLQKKTKKLLEPLVSENEWIALTYCKWRRKDYFHRNLSVRMRGMVWVLCIAWPAELYWACQYTWHHVGASWHLILCQSLKTCGEPNLNVYGSNLAASNPIIKKKKIPVPWVALLLGDLCLVHLSINWGNENNPIKPFWVGHGVVRLKRLTIKKIVKCEMWEWQNRLSV